MPSTKDFDKKNKAKADLSEETTTTSGKTKRRPGREEVEVPDNETLRTSAADAISEDEVKVVDVEDGIQGTSQATEPETQETPEFYTQEDDKNRIEITFAGSEMLRAKFPKPFEVIETVATDWVNDGKFEGLPLGHPLAQYFAAKGLRKAKDVEKKVLESPVTEKVAMQAFTVGLKAQQIINEVREKIKK